MAFYTNGARSGTQLAFVGRPVVAVVTPAAFVSFCMSISLPVTLEVVVCSPVGACLKAVCQYLNVLV